MSEAPRDMPDTETRRGSTPVERDEGDRVDAALLDMEGRLATLTNRILAFEGRIGPPQAGSPGVSAPHHAWRMPVIDAARHAALLAEERGLPLTVDEDCRDHLEWLAARAPVLDLGCGGGALLALLAQRDVAAEGVDSNPVCAATCASLGLQVSCAPALLELAGREEGTLGAVCMLDLVEYVDASGLVDLLNSAVHVVRGGGGLLIETPDRSSTLAALMGLWNDPLRVRPWPAGALRLLVESAGFEIEDLAVREAHAANRPPRLVVRARRP